MFRTRTRPWNNQLLWFSLLVIMGCSSGTTLDSYVDRVVDPDGVPAVINGRLPQKWDGEIPRLVLEKVAVIGQESGPDEQLISSPWLRYSVGPDGQVGYFERRPTEFRVYDNDGSFLFRAGRQGEGPGEFSYISIVQYLDNYGWALIGSPFRMLIFDEHGQFKDMKRTQSLGVRALNRMELCNDGTLWFWKDDPVEWGVAYGHLMRGSWQTMEADTVLSVPVRQLVADGDVGWQTYYPQSLAVDTQGRAWINHNTDYEIVVLEPVGDRFHRVRREYKQIPDPEYRNPDIDPDSVGMMMDWKQIHRKPTEFFPAINNMQWISDDELWAFQGAYIDSPYVQVDVFAPDGTYMRAFQADESLGRAQISDGYAWLLSVDENDVPQFTRYYLRLEPELK